MQIRQKNFYNPNISFKSYYKPCVKKVRSEYLFRADYLIPIVEDMNLTLNKLDSAKTPMAKNLLDFLKMELRLFKFNASEKKLVFNNGKSNFIVSTNGKNSISFQEQNKETGAIEKMIKTENRSLVNQSDSVKRVDLAEGFLQQVLDCVDFALLKYRKIVAKSENLEIIQDSAILEQKATDSLLKVKNETERGILPSNLIDKIAEIEKFYTKIFEDLNSVSNPATRSRFKNDYYNIIKSPRGSRIIGFKKEGYDLFVNYANDHLKKYLILQKFFSDGKVENLILNKEGKAYKQKALSCLKDNKGCVEFYSQDEIASAGFQSTIQEAQKELLNYSEFLQEKINMKDSRLARLSTAQTGVLSQKTLDLASKVKTKYEECKIALASIHDKSKKDKAKEFFRVSARTGSPSFILRNVTDKNEDLQISFPVVNGIQCTKILVLEGVDIIKQSFFIMGENLVKFEAKKLGRSARIDNKLNYYSQKEVDSFCVEEYLKTIIQKLEQVTKGIYNKEYL